MHRIVRPRDRKRGSPSSAAPAPSANTAPGPTVCQSTPATRLAATAAAPVASLNAPCPVARRVAGDRSDTRPCRRRRWRRYRPHRPPSAATRRRRSRPARSRRRRPRRPAARPPARGACRRGRRGGRAAMTGPSRACCRARKTAPPPSAQAEVLRAQQQEHVGRVAQGEDGPCDRERPERPAHVGQPAGIGLRGRLCGRAGMSRIQRSANMLRMAGPIATAITWRSDSPASSRARASSGPTTAPSESMKRWKPNTVPVRPGLAGVAQQRVARRGADALAGAVEHARAEHPPPGRRDRHQRLGDVRERVAGPHERHPPAHAVGAAADRQTDDLRGGVRGSLDRAHSRGRRSQRDGQKQGQHGIRRLRRGIVQEARPAHRPHVPVDAESHRRQR